MTIAALEVLRLIELLDKNDRVVNLAKFTPADLKKKLLYYRETRIRSAISDAQKSVPMAEDFAAVISCGSAENSIDSLLPSCFAYSRVYVDDPLIRLALPQDDASDAFNKWTKCDTSKPLDIQAVRDALRHFQSLSPLIRIGALMVLPIQELVSPSRRPDEGVPIFYSEDWFRSEVPKHIHDFVHKNARIKEVAQLDGGGGFAIFQHAPTSPTRGIAIRFKNDRRDTRMPFYLLSEARFLKDTGDSRFRISQELNWDIPPKQSSYDAWVYQSINRTIINRLGSLTEEIRFAAGLKASYVTDSQFESELCGLAMEMPSSTDSRATAVDFLNATAPYLRLDDPQILAQLRTEKSAIFERWQHSMLSAIRELNGYEGDFTERARQIFESDIQPQVDELNKALITFSSNAGGATLVTAGSIGLAIATSGALPFSTALGLGLLTMAGSIVPAAAEYFSSKNSPAFIWSKISKKRR